MASSPDAMLTVARTVAERWIALPEIRAVALGGSLARHLAESSLDLADPPGDIDLYAYAEPIPELAVREAAVHSLGAREIQMDRQSFETDDSWIDAGSGTLVELMYRSPGWIEGHVADVMDHHRAAIGYTTSLVDSVVGAIPLADPDGWFARLQASAGRPYPSGLSDAIIAMNWPIIRDTHADYRYQLISAVRRDDRNSVIHRTAAILASYWDILFAINGALHPGEKRLVAHAERRCPERPADLRERIAAIAAGVGRPGPELLTAIDDLLDDLDRRMERLPRR